MKPSLNEYSFTTEAVEGPTSLFTRVIATPALTIVMASLLGVEGGTAEVPATHTDVNATSNFIVYISKDTSPYSELRSRDVVLPCRLFHWIHLVANANRDKQRSYSQHFHFLSSRFST